MERARRHHRALAAAAFGLEELGHARKRGAKILGEVVGFAAGFDRTLSGATLARVIRNALANAGIQPTDVDHVNAHGYGVPELDVREAAGLRAALGAAADCVPVFAAKGYVGNLGAAAGLTEIVFGEPVAPAGSS